ncbi:TPM domain-containing protein [Peribacillus saganii]|uniref:TPM domain-containing protein n=1 Tax=Peribacillus saganii TaxID=2303992 RepID=A0A372LQN5_9BACI|nr:TPM domain-containing protein [Peribacillus saganii]RFU70543.1 TPM domain-containing protein [Peribacillus saganii]
MKKRTVSSLCLVLFVLVFWDMGGAAASLPIPKPAGDIYVQDLANILSQQEENELLRLGRMIEDKTSNQVAVLTVETTGGAEIQEFANEAFRTYGIGQSEKDNGVMLVLAMKEKKIWIEVGYGLEGVIPDGRAGRILDERAVPMLQEGKPNIAIMQTYSELADAVSNENAGDGRQDRGQESALPGWLLVVIIAAVVILDFKFFGGTLSYALISMLSFGRGNGGGPRGGGGGSSGGGGAGRGW